MNEKTPANDREGMWREWAAKAQSGDKKAYNRLLSDIIPYIRGYLMPKLANPEWVDDVVQTVLISVHKSLKTYDPERPFKPWLTAITSFRKADFLRRHYRKNHDKTASLDHPEFLTQHVTNPDHRGEFKDVENALSDLPDQQRRVFELVRIRGYTSQEAAEKMGMTVSAVKVSVHRTTKKLKKKLQ